MVRTGQIKHWKKHRSHAEIRNLANSTSRLYNRTEMNNTESEVFLGDEALDNSVFEVAIQLERVDTMSTPPKEFIDLIERNKEVEIKVEQMESDEKENAELDISLLYPIIELSENQREDAPKSIKMKIRRLHNTKNGKEVYEIMSPDNAEALVSELAAPDIPPTVELEELSIVPQTEKPAFVDVPETKALVFQPPAPITKYNKVITCGMVEIARPNPCTIHFKVDSNLIGRVIGTNHHNIKEALTRGYTVILRGTYFEAKRNDGGPFQDDDCLQFFKNKIESSKVTGQFCRPSSLRIPHVPRTFNPLFMPIRMGYGQPNPGTMRGFHPMHPQWKNEMEYPRYRRT